MNYIPHLAVCQVPGLNLPVTSELPGNITLSGHDIKILFREDGCHGNSYVIYREGHFITFSKIHAQVSFVVYNKDIIKQLDKLSTIYKSNMYVKDEWGNRLPHITLAICGEKVFSVNELYEFYTRLKDIVNNKFNNIDIKFNDFRKFGKKRNKLVMVVEYTEQIKKIREAILKEISKYYS